MKNTPGADDNGAGVAALLTIAKIVSQYSFNHTIVFVAFSGEEQGLLGSHAYAKEAYLENKNIIVELNADMIGHAETLEGGHSIRTPATIDAKWITDDILEINNVYNLSFTNIIQSTINEEGRGGSDYYSFVQYGFESVAFFENEWNPYMHQPGDDISNVNMSYLLNTTRLIAATIAYLADIEPRAPQASIASPRRGYLYFDGRESKIISDLKTVIIGDISIWVEIKYNTTSITKTEFYYDDKLVYTDTTPPFNYHLTTRSLFREHKIKAIIYDDKGNTSNTWITIRYIHPFIRR
ncbi:MAG: M28 family peptidase [Candidatus Thermoplasmatota archaeon]